MSSLKIPFNSSVLIWRRFFRYSEFLINFFSGTKFVSVENAIHFSLLCTFFVNIDLAMRFLHGIIKMNFVFNVTKNKKKKCSKKLRWWCSWTYGFEIEKNLAKNGYLNLWSDLFPYTGQLPGKNQSMLEKRYTNKILIFPGQTFHEHRIRIFLSDKIKQRNRHLGVMKPNINRIHWCSKVVQCI